MGKTSIKIDCVDQRLFVSSGPVIASGGKNEDLVEFSFCQLWDGFEKYAVFYRSKDAVYRSAVSENQCVIPHEVLADDGWIYIGVFGTNGDVTRTSEVLKYRVAEGAITEGTKPSDPTPDIYAQFMNRVAAVEERTRAVESFTINPDAYEVNGNIVHIDNYEGMPLNCVTTIAPKQAGAGEPSPDNVRQISGWTGAKLTRCGKNLAKSMKSPGDTSIYFVSLFIDADLKPSTTYTLSFVGTAGNKVYINEHIATEFHDIYMSGGHESITFTTKSVISTDNYEQYNSSEKAWMILKNGEDLSTPTVFTDVQLELGSTATVYEPYQGDTYTADFGRTVYGGTLDWQTGVLTVEWAMITPGQDSTISSNRPFVQKSNTVQISVACQNAIPATEYIISNVFPSALFNWNEDFVSVAVMSEDRIDIAMPKSTLTRYGFDDGSDYSKDVTAFKAWLTDMAAAGTPVQVCYKLATPVTIQLTPHEIYAISGSNNIWCDVGKITVSGRKDILWLTSNLIKRLNACESAIISLGGNV